MIHYIIHIATNNQISLFILRKRKRYYIHYYNKYHKAVHQATCVRIDTNNYTYWKYIASSKALSQLGMQREIKFMGTKVCKIIESWESTWELHFVVGFFLLITIMHDNSQIWLAVNCRRPFFHSHSFLLAEATSQLEGSAVSCQDREKDLPSCI